MAKEDVITSEVTPLYKHVINQLKECEQENLKSVLQETQSSIFTPESEKIYFDSPSLMRSKIDIELKIAELRRQQLNIDKKVAEEVFKAKENALEAETKLALTMIEVYPTSGLPLNNTADINVNGKNVFANASAPPAITFEDDPITSNTSAQNVTSSLPLLGSAIGTAGLSQLSSLDRVKVQLVSSPSLNETYEVLGIDGSTIFHVKISLTVVKGDSKRSFQGEMYDKQHEEVMKFHINESGALEVMAGNEKVRLVKRQPTLIKPVLTINNTDGNVLLKVKGQGFGSKIPIFSIENAEKVHIGCINKALHNTAKPSDHVDAQLSSIDFPRDLDVNCKAAIIACNFLIVNSEHAMIRSRLLQKEMLAA